MNELLHKSKTGNKGSNYNRGRKTAKANSLRRTLCKKSVTEAVVTKRKAFAYRVKIILRNSVSLPGFTTILVSTVSR